MNSNLKDAIASVADPEMAGKRLENLLGCPEIEQALTEMSQGLIDDFVNIISFSSFLYRYLCRQPDTVRFMGQPYVCEPGGLADITDMQALKAHKYRELLKITWMDISGQYDYPKVLKALSHLADSAIKRALGIIVRERDLEFINRHLCGFALGKLGACELNFSSDIDLVYVCSNTSDVDIDIHRYQQLLQDTIRKLSNQLEDMDANGFLYRVDLKLRPWGNSGPLVMTIDETENYYEASSEAWERFAWLRARWVLGSEGLASDFLERINPFIYRRSLGSDDLDRFLEIKNEMSRIRQRKGYWNVKVGEGGIRDLEFFVQMLQIVNAYTIPSLQTTGTLNILGELYSGGLLPESEALEIRHSYLFLRKLENRLQMVDELQTHELPDDWSRRTVLARSMGMKGDSNDEILDNFETELFSNKTIARNCFEKILPDTPVRE